MIRRSLSYLLLLRIVIGITLLNWIKNFQVGSQITGTSLSWSWVVSHGVANLARSLSQELPFRNLADRGLNDKDPDPWRDTKSMWLAEISPLSSWCSDRQIKVRFPSAPTAWRAFGEWQSLVIMTSLIDYLDLGRINRDDMEENSKPLASVLSWSSYSSFPRSWTPQYSYFAGKRGPKICHAIQSSSALQPILRINISHTYLANRSYLE